MLYQEMGRVNRLLLASPGEHKYQVYKNVNTFIGLWMRTQREKVASVRKRQVMELRRCLEVLVLPVECYHLALEREFENPATFDPSRMDHAALCVHSAPEHTKNLRAHSRTLA